MGTGEETESLVSQGHDTSKGYGTLPKNEPSDQSVHQKKKRKKVQIAKEKKSQKEKISLWSLFYYSKPLDVFFMILGTCAAIINGAGWPLLAIVFGSMTNTFLTQSPSPVTVSYSNTSFFNDSASMQIFGNQTTPDFEEVMTTFSLYYVYIGIAVFIASVTQILLWMMACERQVYIMRQEFFYQVLRHEIAWFDKNQSGELTAKLNDDLERVREGIGDKFSMLIQFGSTFVAGFIVGFIKGWQLTLVIMSLTPLLALSSAFLGKLVASSSAREQQKYAVAGGIAEEVLSSIRTVTSFNGQEREVKRYHAALLDGMNVAIRKYVYMAFGIGFTFLVLYGSYAVAFWYGAQLVIDGKMTAGDVFSVFFAVMIGSFSLGNAMPHLTTVATAKGSAEKIFDIIKAVPKIDPYSREGIHPTQFTADIEFNNVYFNYPSRKTVRILKNFSLKIKEGQTIALCGPSGSGKSTIVNLILRFYDPNKGTVTLGNFGLPSLNVHWLRSKIGLVSQEPVLFSGTIAKNIEYGHQGVVFTDIVAAAKMANAHDFIVQLPKGYDTLVGERGAQLSGGQKQRIAIARALVRDPRILLLDEATSALDAESEAIVQQALDKAQEGRTTVVIAHRLSTIRNADVICAMENGEIKEKGTHDELMAKRGIYYQLVTNQIFAEENDVCSSEQDVKVGAEFDIPVMRRKRSSAARAIHESHRLISRLESEVKEENVDIPSGFQILKQSKQEWKEIVVGSLASIVTGVVMPTYAIFYSEIFRTFTLTGNALRKSAFFWSMMFLVLAVVTMLGHFFRAIGYSFAGEQLTMKLRYKAFTNIIRQNIGWFDDSRHTSGKISTRLATDVPMIKSAAGIRIGTVISALVTLAASITIAFIFGWKLALALLVAIPILLICGALQMKTMKGNQKRDAELMADAGDVACETVENIKTVQSLTLEETFYERYVGHLLIPFMENKKNAKVYALAFAMSQAIMFFTYAAAFRLGAFLVARNDMVAVDVYRVFFAMAFSAVSVGQWSSYLPDYAKAKLSAGLIFNLINMEPSIDSSSKGGIKPEIKGKVTFKDVFFRYPSRKNILILRGINLTVEPGQTLALVGTSGCGKSTLISLLERFYDPETGKVLVDDFDIKTINLKYLRSQMSLVSQEPTLFNCSIRDNIVYGIEDKVSQVEIENAARIANVHEFIIGLPLGYQTMVGERGTQLSGGQKQRVAIARAIVRNPKILLLDEATSALDTESEKIVQLALDKAREGRTCIVIAHRLSTVQGADCIAVIDHGKVVEIGTHKELVNKKGFYYKLIKKQYNLISIKVKKSLPSRNVYIFFALMGVKEESQNLVFQDDNYKNYGTIYTSEEKKRKKSKTKKGKKSSEAKISIWQLFRYSKPLDIFFMILGSLSAVINGAGWPLLAIVFGSMTNTFLTQSPTSFSTSYVNKSFSNNSDSFMESSAYEKSQALVFEEMMTMYSLYYVYIGIAVFIASVTQILLWMMACERQVYEMRQKYFYQVLRHEIAWFDSHQSGDLTAKLNDDLERVREGIGDKFSMLIQYASTFVAGFIVGFIKGWQLTLVIMSLTPLLALSSAFIGKMVSTSSSREQKKYAIAGGIAEEVLSSIRTVTAFNGQDREIKRYHDALLDGMNIALKKYKYVGSAFGFTFLVLYGSYALAFWYGAKLVLDNSMTAGDVFSVFFAVMIGSFSLGNAMPHLTSVATAKGSGEKIFDIIETVPKIDPYSKEGIKPDAYTADIEFHDVHFNYPTRKGVKVLKNFSLTVKEGQTIALCGASGSGKSTIVNLILRFYDPNHGMITLGNYDLQSLNVHWLRSKIGLVSQEPILFDGSIFENIEYGHQGVSFSEVVAAAKMANAHDFIIQLPKGYDTYVGERGAQLSGGQKQRIAIARALVRDPRILLLDEATSALDAESEAIVQQALDKAQQGRTTVVIAHRLSTIKNADVICAMENGEIKEQGTHEELMEKHGIYYQLVINQVFADEGEIHSSEQESKSAAEYSMRLAKKRSSSVRAIPESFRLLSRLESEVKEENIEIPTGWEILRKSKQEWMEIVFGLFAAVITGIVMPAYAIFYSEIFNTFTMTGEALRQSAFFWSMMFLVLAIVACLGYTFRTIGFCYAGEKLTKRLRTKTFINILRQDIGWFDDAKHSTGKISTRLSTDVPMVKSAGGIRIGSVLSAIVTLLSSIVIAFIFGWKLALALMLAVPLLLLSGVLQMKTLKGNQKRDAELMADAGNVACEAIENIKTVQSLTLEKTFYERYVEKLLVPFKENKKNANVYALCYAFSQAIMFFTYAAAFRFGAYLVARNAMVPVNVYRVFFAMAFSAVSVGQWFSYLPDYAKAKLSAGLIFHLMSLEPPIDSDSKGGIKPEIKGKVKLINVSFRYPSRRNILILRGINLTVDPGKTLALVGTSGCGKSTIISLLERFYDPETGKVMIDEFDIKIMNLKYLRSQMSLVSQEPTLFNCSIKDNIIYGIEGKVNQADIEKAARIANIHDFIKQLPKGYQTMVGERGTQLSGGQKQRVAIARAIVRNPKILLLDEATSALDTESEKIVQEALDQARAGRTCIVIAHRLSTIQGADCIAVIDHGKVVEKGTHNELLNKKGFYYKLVKKQFK
nr:uncharacterized protein LOC107456703 [Parasteatoda tepidariorum]